ncbi:hypothetical protein SNK04_001109 [Fusarium graminearum]
MTDRRSRRDRDRESLRVPRARPHRSSRNSSVRSSARSSANYEEPRHRHPSTGPTSYPAAVPAPYPTNSPYSYPSAANSSRSLRAASSRFSLNEQFAATRQDFNLWDDDASSIYDQGINEDDEEDDDEDEEDEDKDGDKDEDEDEEDSDDDDSDDEDSEDDEKAALSSTEGNDDTLHEISNAPPVLQASDSNFTTSSASHKAHRSSRNSKSETHTTACLFSFTPTAILHVCVQLLANSSSGSKMLLKHSLTQCAEHNMTWTSSCKLKKRDQ